MKINSFDQYQLALKKVGRALKQYPEPPLDSKEGAAVKELIQAVWDYEDKNKI